MLCTSISKSYPFIRSWINSAYLHLPISILQTPTPWPWDRSHENFDRVSRPVRLFFVSWVFCFCVKIPHPFVCFVFILNSSLDFLWSNCSRFCRQAPMSDGWQPEIRPRACVSESGWEHIGHFSAKISQSNFFKKLLCPINQLWHP